MMDESTGNSAMRRTIALSVLILGGIGTPASAADLPPHTKLGAVFAKPYAPAVREVETYDYPVFVFAPQVDIPPLVNGYYGKPGSYYYRPYYESTATALTDAYTRLPYACGFYGYC
jgi:hypothetical protein